MNKFSIIIVAALAATGCNSAARPVAENANSPVAQSTQERPQTAIAHSLENQQPPSEANTAGRSKWTQGGDPIETKALDSEIAKAEKALSTKPTDEAAKKALATAYFNRATALTKARQYASALGDYRRAVKYDPSNTDAKGWIDQIVTIYDSMGRDAPKEGEEPPPLSSDKPK